MHDTLSVIIDFHNFQIDLCLSTNESAADMLRADTLREEDLYDSHFPRPQLITAFGDDPLERAISPLVLTLKNTGSKLSDTGSCCLEDAGRFPAHPSGLRASAIMVSRY